MLIIDDLTVRIAGRALLEDASARITPGARVGLVGRNGTGKSTLFNVITGDLGAEQGSIEIPPRWRIGRLAQDKLRTRDLKGPANTAECGKAVADALG